jgi:hypothetical protein
VFNVVSPQPFDLVSFYIRRSVSFTCGAGGSASYCF